MTTSLFYVDKVKRPIAKELVASAPQNPPSPHPTMSSDIKSVWVDSDDETVEVHVTEQSRLKKLRVSVEETKLKGETYQERLRTQYEKLHPKPKWATVKHQDHDQDHEPEEEDTRFRLGQYHMKKGTMLSKGVLDIVKLKDANQASSSKSVVQALQFHPNGELLLTGGFDKTLRLFQVDGKVNPLVQSRHFEGLPIHCAKFSPDGRDLLVSGPRPYYYTYELQTGRMEKLPTKFGMEKLSQLHEFHFSHQHLLVMGQSGHTYLLDRDTKRWISTLKMNGACYAADFSPDGQTIYTFGEEHEVYVWDVRQMGRCVQRIPDHGGTRGSRVAASKDYLATGSNSGMVHLYDVSDLSKSPVKEFGHLTTNISSLSFNHDGQLLALASRSEKNALRLVHLPSKTVFSNWPTPKTPLNYVSQVAFSPSSKLLALGNDQGRVLLYQLKHYV